MKRLNLSLTTPNSLQNTIDYLENYKAEINKKTEIVLNKLLDIGIECAKANSGQFKDFIIFRKIIEPEIDGYNGIFLAFDDQIIISEWIYHGVMKQVEVSPLLMAEFGSGQYATVKFPNMEGFVGRGTFPEQKHAFQDSWWWVDTNPENGIPYGNKGFYFHESSGTTPTHPMYQATMAMFDEITRIYREVFANG